jgi:hypothetical protein
VVIARRRIAERSPYGQPTVAETLDSEIAMQASRRAKSFQLLSALTAVLPIPETLP